jgi:hypothetical protein
MIDPRPKVLIAVPGKPEPQVWQMLLNINSDKRIRSHLMVPGGEPSEVWNGAVQAVLKQEVDYLMCVDETAIPLKNPVDLLQFDKDVIGMPSPRMIFGSKGSRYSYQGYAFSEETDEPELVDNARGLMEIDAIAGGILIIARRALERIMAEGSTYSEDPNGMFSTNYHANEHGRESTASTRGIKVWCHYGYPCEAFQSVPIGRVMQDLVKAGTPDCKIMDIVTAAIEWQTDDTEATEAQLLAHATKLERAVEAYLETPKPAEPDPDLKIAKEESPAKQRLPEAICPKCGEDQQLGPCKCGIQAREVVPANPEPSPIIVEA